jgi:hypothetical protein
MQLSESGRFLFQLAVEERQATAKDEILKLGQTGLLFRRSPTDATVGFA